MRNVIRQSARVLFGVLVVAAVLFITSSAANAEFSAQIVTVTATAGPDSASYSWEMPKLADVVSDPVTWSMQEENLQLRSQGGAVIGTVEDLVVMLYGDPQVNVDFSVSAGNTPTTFTITSALVSFQWLKDVQGFASAGVTLTDSTGDGASLNLASGWNGLYRATYNGSTVFAELLAAQSIAGPGTISSSTDSGVQAIPGLVNSIQASYAFKLSAKDYASGSSQFEVIGTTSDVPEPSMFAMMAFGLLGLLLGLRRR
ncbi:MAG: PEP-CTERM sorting domain-containing protein [Planctomycetia bacterium]|nr:PEP-CTERM sorting domain-containing protein [Planctomycetia bacterium]